MKNLKNLTNKRNVPKVECQVVDWWWTVSVSDGIALIWSECYNADVGPGENLKKMHKTSTASTSLY